MKQAFVETFGDDTAWLLPPLKEPLARRVESTWMVNNAYWTQALANCFQASVIVGLEDAEDVCSGIREYYSAAIYFQPNSLGPKDRYAKRVLVPMGEYIPFSFCEKMAQQYGVYGSFTCGKEAKVWNCKGVPLGVSICYEETFGDMMRENREQGAAVLVNLTSDVWYPNSRLPRQHFTHALVRTVEMGIPLIRSCNTGVTGACDSLGREISVLEEEDGADSLRVTVPLYTYQTLYSKVGDGLIVGFSFLIVLFFFRYKRFS